MSEQFKIIDFSVSDGKLHLCIDPNQNGKCLLTLTLDIAEIPSEIASLLFKKEENA